MALTSRCGLRRRAGPTGSTCGEAAFLHGKGPEVRAHIHPVRTFCARLLALRRVARPQLALMRRPPPLGRVLPTTTSRSTASLRFLLTDMQRAHRRHIQHRHARRHHARRHHVRRLLCRAVDLRWRSSASPVRLLVGRREADSQPCAPAAPGRPGHVAACSPLNRMYCRDCRREPS